MSRTRAREQAPRRVRREATGRHLPLVPSNQEARRFAQRLVAWYRAHRRDLPWRKTRDPYAIWVSEVMLQQTQVRTVLGYYSRFLERFPTIHDLARAGDDDVLHAWQGLGYYSRARRLLAGAREVVRRHAGELPRGLSELRELPGIGPYSAGAIASIAFGLAEPVVDGNVVRVLCRAFGLRGDPTRGPLKRRLWQLARELVPREAPGDFNQGLMELGATVCTPVEPRCTDCPLGHHCSARSAGLVTQLPELPVRSAPTERRVAAAIVEQRGRVLLVQAPPEARQWARLWVFPFQELEGYEGAAEGAARAAERAAGTTFEAIERVALLKHSITRFRITLEAFRCRSTTGPFTPYVGSSWVRWAALGELAMPAPHRRLAELVPATGSTGRPRRRTAS
jgi:A/G-specific adenine glycosylase